jgi:hypothetical protein
MEKFSADTFWAIAKYLADLRHRLEKAGPRDSSPTTRLTKDSTGYNILNRMRTLCEKVGLRVSMKCVDHMMAQALREESKLGVLVEAVSQVERTIKWEMEDKLFMYIPPERAERYDQKELLGKDVNAKFPALQYDIAEAGTCYACGRSTAVVFHLMRIMEVGVQAFGTKLGVSLVKEKVWQVILDGINAAIKKLPPKDPATIELAQVSANLYSVKLAWRNEVMHPKDTYTLEEADNLIRQVKIFMEQLVNVV